MLSRDPTRRTQPTSDRKGKAAPVASRYYVAVYRPTKGSRGGDAHSVAAVAREADGRILEYRIYQEK